MDYSCESFTSFCDRMMIATPANEGTGFDKFKARLEAFIARVKITIQRIINQIHRLTQDGYTPLAVDDFYMNYNGIGSSEIEILNIIRVFCNGIYDVDVSRIEYAIKENENYCQLITQVYEEHKNDEKWVHATKLGNVVVISLMLDSLKSLEKLKLHIEEPGIKELCNLLIRLVNSEIARMNANIRTVKIIKGNKKIVDY